MKSQVVVIITTAFIARFQLNLIIWVYIKRDEVPNHLIFVTDKKKSNSGSFCKKKPQLVEAKLNTVCVSK